MNCSRLFFIFSFFISSVICAADAQRPLPATVLPRPFRTTHPRPITDYEKNNTPKWVAPTRSPQEKSEAPQNQLLEKRSLMTAAFRQARGERIGNK